MTNPKANGRETQRHYYFSLEQLGAGTSFRTITDTKERTIWIQLSTAPIGIGLTTYLSHSHAFIKKAYDFTDLNQAGFT